MTRSRRTCCSAPISGGTDVCSAFIGSNPLLPVYAGETQSPYLGVRIESWSDAGESLVDEVGELVVTEPMPSMPVAFWNDPDGSRYRDAYFGTFPGVWRHGDWLTSPRGTYIVHGRSDSTINRGGVRMGSADIYAAVEAMPEIAGSMVIGAELPGGEYCMPLFVVLAPGAELYGGPARADRQAIREQVSPGTFPTTSSRLRRCRDADRQEAGGADQAAHPGRTAGEGGESGHGRQSRGAAVVHRLRRRTPRPADVSTLSHKEN